MIDIQPSRRSIYTFAAPPARNREELHIVGSLDGSEHVPTRRDCTPPVMDSITPIIPLWRTPMARRKDSVTRSTLKLAATSIRMMSLCLVVSLAILESANADNPRNTLVGAIRWDGWVGNAATPNAGADYVGQQMQRALGPHQYHDRLPFYAEPPVGDSVYIDGNRQ